MKILITNDDGIYSPGIKSLAEVAVEFGEARIYAPDVEQSSMGHAITHSRPLSVRHTPGLPVEAYRVNGTPADCVALGVHLWEGVDLVLSGINMGYNLGNSMWHSGTLAGAKQAHLLGIQGAALSAPSESVEDSHFSPLAPFVEQVLRLLLTEPRPPLTNINFPPEPTGLRWTRQSVRHYNGYIVPSKDPFGRDHYWFGVTPLEAPEPGTDRHAVQQGMVSLTPLRLDLTDHEELNRMLLAEA
jgi:5'-nucleotidase